MKELISIGARFKVLMNSKMKSIVPVNQSGWIPIVDRFNNVKLLADKYQQNLNTIKAISTTLCNKTDE